MRLIAALLLSVTLAHGQSLSQKGAAEIDALLQKAVEQGTVPGLVAEVATGNQVFYYRAVGMKDVAGQKPMTTDSIFRIASMTKPITSAAILLLQEQGKLRLDDPVSKYLPEFKDRDVIATFNSTDGSFATRKASGEILIRHLLSHTSGLAYSFSNPVVGQLQQKTGKQAEDLPLLYDPGTRWTYSGST